MPIHAAPQRKHDKLEDAWIAQLPPASESHTLAHRASKQRTGSQDPNHKLTPTRTQSGPDTLRKSPRN
jgi:hypothetical protein